MASTPAYNDTSVNPEQEKCIGGVMVPELKSGATLSKLLSLKLTSYSSGSTVILWADYQTGDPAKGASGTASNTFTVKSPTKPTADSLKVETKIDSASLHETQSGSVLLKISNGTDDIIKLSTSPSISPPNTSVEPLGISATTALPQSEVTISYKISPAPKIFPGKYLGVIDVDAQMGCGVSVKRAASYEVTFGVFGESGLFTTLNLLNVPSLLFLPGFLILTLWMILWRLKWRVSFLAKSSSVDEFFVGAKDPEFWLLGVTFSLLLFLILQNGILKSEIGIGYGGQPYNLTSIAKLWGISLIISFVLYAALIGIDRWRTRRANAAKAAVTLTSNDDVLTVVEKMEKRGWERRYCFPVKSKAGLTPEISGFRLWEESHGETLWVIPQIEWITPPENLGEFDIAKPDIAMSELLRQLREITAKKLGSVQWEEGAGFNGPRLMKLTELDESIGDMVVVRPV
jgi:hypothetical protein